LCFRGSGGILAMAAPASNHLIWAAVQDHFI
jgi:hypothetical protein